MTAAGETKGLAAGNAGFCSRSAPTPPVLRGLDAKVAKLRHRRAAPLGMVSLPATSALAEFEEFGHRHQLDGNSLGFVGAALEAAGDGHDPIVAAAAAALLAGEFVEGLSPTETARATAIAAIAHGWSPRPCHVIGPEPAAVLAWAETAAPLCAKAGLTLTAIDGEASPAERQKAYTADVVAVTSRTLMADLGRDHMTLGPFTNSGRRAVAQLCRSTRAQATNTVTRGLSAVVLLDAEQTLFADGVTPSRLTQSVEHPMLIDQCRAAIDFAPGLHEGEHFHLRDELQRIEWTRAGEQALDDSPAHRDFVGDAIRATHLLERDRHYRVDRDGRLVLLDDSSGQELPGRTYRQGLQQIVELIEGIPTSPLHEVVVQNSAPDLYRSTNHLCGCARSLDGLRGELFAVFRRQSRRARPAPEIGRVEIFRDSATLEDDLIRRATPDTAIVTATKASADSLSRALRAAKVITCPEADTLPPSTASNRVLYARLPATRLIAGALGDAADRIEFCASLDDPLLRGKVPRLLSQLARKFSAPDGKLPRWISAWLCQRFWGRAAKTAAKQRAALIRGESWGRSILGR